MLWPKVMAGFLVVFAFLLHEQIPVLAQGNTEEVDQRCITNKPTKLPDVTKLIQQKSESIETVPGSKRFINATSWTRPGELQEVTFVLVTYALGSDTFLYLWLQLQITEDYACAYVAFADGDIYIPAGPLRSALSGNNKEILKVTLIVLQNGQKVEVERSFSIPLSDLPAAKSN